MEIKWGISALLKLFVVLWPYITFLNSEWMVITSDHGHICQMSGLLNAFFSSASFQWTWNTPVYCAEVSDGRHTDKSSVSVWRKDKYFNAGVEKAIVTVEIIRRRAALKISLIFTFKSVHYPNNFLTTAAFLFYPNAFWDGYLHNLHYILLWSSLARLIAPNNSPYYNTGLFTCWCPISSIFTTGQSNPKHRLIANGLHWGSFISHPYNILYGQLQTPVPTGLPWPNKHTQAAGIYGRD